MVQTINVSPNCTTQEDKNSNLIPTQTQMLTLMLQTGTLGLDFTGHCEIYQNLVHI